MADSLILLLQTITSASAADEFHPSYTYALTMAVYAGMLIGALFWGISADIIGRRFAFNVSLFISSTFAIAGGASPNWTVLALFVSLSAFGAGGNLILDTTVFLEYLPSRQQWLLTLMAMWWGFAPVIAAAFAWPFLSQARWNCNETPGPCTYANNKGWRFVWYANGSLMLAMSVARVTIIRLHETPKFLIGQGRDAEVIEGLRQISDKYNRPMSLTVERLEACGQIGTIGGAGGKKGIAAIWWHVKGLFATRKLGLSTCLIWLSWLMIGLAYPLYFVFLPEYLGSRGAQTGQPGNYYKWRNYLITNVCGIFGPVLAGVLCNIRFLGRKYTMVIGALITMVFLFAYTAVRTPGENLGFNCAISFCINVYYGCLYAYTPEGMSFSFFLPSPPHTQPCPSTTYRSPQLILSDIVLPSAHRATGNGIAVACNRVMGLISAVVAQTANTSTSAPIFVCAALYIGMALVAALFPFEPYGRRSM